MQKQIENELKSFRINVEKLIQFEEKLCDICYKLNGGISSVKFDGLSVVSNSTTSKILELMHQEQHYTKNRDYYLYAVKRVAHYLQQLDSEEVELLEMRYWYNYSIRVCAQLTYQSKRTISRKLKTIYEKLEKQAFN